MIGAAELQRRESEYKISQARNAPPPTSCNCSVSALGDRAPRPPGAGGINSVTPVVSPPERVVVERKLAQGQVVQPADALVRGCRPVAGVGGPGAGAAGQPGQAGQTVNIGGAGAGQ